MQQKKGNRSNDGLTRKTMNINLPRPRLVMAVWFRMNSTPNAVETNTENQLLCVISVVHTPSPSTPTQATTNNTEHATVRNKRGELATVISRRDWQDGKPFNNSDPDCWLWIGAPSPDRTALIKNRHWYRRRWRSLVWSRRATEQERETKKGTTHIHTINTHAGS